MDKFFRIWFRTISYLRRFLVSSYGGVDLMEWVIIALLGVVIIGQCILDNHLARIETLLLEKRK